MLVQTNFLKILLVRKNLKSNSGKVGFFFQLHDRIFLNLQILKLIPDNM